MHEPGQKRIVNDSDSPKLHRKIVTLIKRNPRNTAEWEVQTEAGNTWTIHGCFLQALPTDRSAA